MASLNSVTLIGLLGRDPEEVHAGQSRFARLSVATGGGADDEWLCRAAFPLRPLRTGRSTYSKRSKIQTF